VRTDFYDPGKHIHFPDLLQFFADVSQQEVTAFAARTLVPEQEVRTFAGVQPMSPVMFAIAVFVIVSLAVRGVGWTLTRPVDMTTILYMARFQVPVLLQVGAAVLIGGVGLIVVRLTVFFVQSLALDSLVTTGSYSVQMLCYGVMVSAAVVLFILCLSTIPRKIIVFPGLSVSHHKVGRLTGHRDAPRSPGLVQEETPVPVRTALVGPGRSGNLSTAIQGSGLLLPHEKHGGDDWRAGWMAGSIRVTGVSEEEVGFRHESR